VLYLFSWYSELALCLSPIALEEVPIPTDAIPLLVQIPVVAIFVWYTLQIVRMYQESATAQVANLTRTLEAHESAFIPLAQLIAAQTEAIRGLTSAIVDAVQNHHKEGG